MSKKKIGELNGRPIVVGDPNIINNNEILYTQIGNYIALSERSENNDLRIITVGEDHEETEE